LKQLHRTREIPIILLTVKAGELSAEDVAAAGAMTAMAKPYDSARLQRLLEDIVSPQAKS
jgi:CheY-like chemotaxis protein